jgi:hypothetical protein
MLLSWPPTRLLQLVSFVPLAILWLRLPLRPLTFSGFNLVSAPSSRAAGRSSRTQCAQDDLAALDARALSLRRDAKRNDAKRNAMCDAEFLDAYKELESDAREAFLRLATMMRHHEQEAAEPVLLPEQVRSRHHARQYDRATTPDTTTTSDIREGRWPRPRAALASARGFSPIFRGLSVNDSRLFFTECPLRGLWSRRCWAMSRRCEGASERRWPS